MIDTLVEPILLIVFLLILTLLTIPLGRYMAGVFQNKITFLKPVEDAIYRLSGIPAGEEMDWKGYAIAMVLFNLLGIVVLFIILIIQNILPLNPEGFAGMRWDTALNTAVSFVSNTNWQSYAGESTVSYFTQMAGLTVQNFVSAATGICIAIALIRGIASRGVNTLGNFWVDMVRCVLYILLPLSLILAIALMSQGVIQNFNSYVDTAAIGGGNQTIPMGPVASQEAIKELGTNGGGYMNANSAHPFENPNWLTNILEIAAILLISLAMTRTFGIMVNDKRQGWAIYAVIMVLFVACFGVMYAAESYGNPLIQNVTGPYLEGKEVRNGLMGSVLFATATTATSCGAVNSMHDSYTPIGGMMTMFLILLGEIAPGGVGSGLYTMLAYIVVAVFIAGLMIGRTPQFLGKKIEALDMRASVVIILIASLLILILSAIAVLLTEGTSSVLNPGPHGLSAILYAFASMANNNGSAFAGLSVNTVFYNVLGALAMLIGRFVPALAALALAGSLAAKRYAKPTAETLPTHRLPFIIWLIFVILIIGVLTFLPAMAVGPYIENILMGMGVTF
jgi:K+-transporting ATPase ATPase A chain